jgi:hypothetical protein
MMTTWRYYFDLGVIFLSLLASFVSLALIRPWGRIIPRWILRTMAWIASAMLTLRGVAGLVVDGTRDPIWWPTFLVGGVLFAIVARLAGVGNRHQILKERLRTQCGRLFKRQSDRRIFQL